MRYCTVFFNVDRSILMKIRKFVTVQMKTIMHYRKNEDDVPFSFLEMSRVEYFKEMDKHFYYLTTVISKKYEQTSQRTIQEYIVKQNNIATLQTFADRFQLMIQSCNRIFIRDDLK